MTEQLRQSGEIEVLLGNGWYKGVFGLSYANNNYGDRFALIAQLHLEYEDGSEEVVITDGGWKAKGSCIMTSGIYDGEIIDATCGDEEYGWLD